MDLRPDEKPEFPIEGPFGGVLDTDFPSSKKEQYKGFASSLNILFREGNASVRPSYTTLPNTPDTLGIVGAFDFYNSAGNRVNAIATKTHLYQWNVAGQAWAPITAALGGGVSDLFSATVVGQKLCFDQGVDTIWIWDGISGVASQPAGAPVARYLMELDNHLLTLNQPGHNQRAQWSGIGDPTDWTSFASGQTDLFNDQGPINGGIKLFQLGYIFQQWGLVQVQPTGIGTAPFAFTPILPSKGKGLFCPYSLAGFKSQLAPYVGKDNVYAFNGIDSEPIGDHPVEGNRRIGARTQLLSDLRTTNPNSVWGQTITAINGHDFNAYFLSIPGAHVTWVYNFDEKNWTRFTFPIDFISVMNDFQQSIPNGLRIIDLIGSIAQQTWSPSTLAGVNPFDSVLIGFTTGAAISFDFTGVSESAWTLSGPEWILGDGRHVKNLIGIRFMITDQAASTATFSITNENGQNTTHVVSFGTGSGAQIEIYVPFDISGVFLTLVISGAAGQPLSISDMTPVYDTGEEIPATTVVS